jgi:hypothetical protein
VSENGRVSNAGNSRNQRLIHVGTPPKVSTNEVGTQLRMAWFQSQSVDGRGLSGVGVENFRSHDDGASERKPNSMGGGGVVPDGLA